MKRYSQEDKGTMIPLKEVPEAVHGDCGEEGMEVLFVGRRVCKMTSWLDGVVVGVLNATEGHGWKAYVYFYQNEK